jgi:hypothetical protein
LLHLSPRVERHALLPGDLYRVLDRWLCLIWSLSQHSDEQLLLSLQDLAQWASFSLVAGRELFCRPYSAL